MEKNAENTPGFTTMDKDDISLVEIGPRFCLSVIRIFEGSFGGPTVFENPEFISPNLVSTYNADIREQKEKRSMDLLRSAY